MIPLAALLIDRVVPLVPAFLITVFGSLAASLVTYALFVRYMPLGFVLHGRRTRPQKRLKAPLTQPEGAAARRA